MMAALKPEGALRLLGETALAIVRDKGPEGHPDFTLRQLSILLTIYLERPPHTVRALAARHGVTKPVVTRALDALGAIDLVTRRRDEADKRNVVVQRTVKGALFVEQLGDLVVEKAREFA
ncbi:MAG: MarR family transcriptional regulator [Hyphomicrobiales bacterium]|nr:MarR family transcriptional regulator [Hyphomicrobiales bacterium]